MAYKIRVFSASKGLASRIFRIVSILAKDASFITSCLDKKLYALTARWKNERPGTLWLTENGVKQTLLLLSGFFLENDTYFSVLQF